MRRENILLYAPHTLVVVVCLWWSKQAHQNKNKCGGKITNWPHIISWRKNLKSAISKLARIATIKKSPPFETKFEMLLVGRTYMMHASRSLLGLFCPVKNVWICVCVRTLAFFCNLYGLQLGGRVFMPSAWKYATLCILWTGIIAASLIMVSARAKCISALWEKIITGWGNWTNFS